MRVRKKDGRTKTEFVRLSSDFIYGSRHFAYVGKRGSRWKVTARYTVQLDAKRSYQCVRLRGPYHKGVAVVVHFSERRFRELFEQANA